MLKTDSNRLLSLDFFRGFIMVLLALEAAGLYEHLFKISEGSFLQNFFLQFFHHPWHGLRFWDLIQPAFMFMAGTAMAFSLHKQKEQGISWEDSFRHILKRCALLFFFGVLDYAVRPQGLSFELWDVLTQLSFTTLVAFLIFNWSITAQIGVIAFLLLLTEMLYRFTNITGFNQAFVDQHNFGNYVDLLLMNKINDGGWVAINCIPTAVHTIGGALAGKLLLSNLTGSDKIKRLLSAGVICLIAGYALDWTVTPVIKRIATSSFVLVSAGYCIFALASSYWWIDIKNHRHNLQFFTIIGMNSIFIYLFFEIVGSRWFNGYVSAITNGLMSFAHFPEGLMMVITSLCIFFLEWGLCYFLYRRKIFFRL
jgi:predicted acyltransferase